MSVKKTQRVYDKVVPFDLFYVKTPINKSATQYGKLVAGYQIDA